MSRFRKAFLVWLVIIVPLVAALTIIGMTYYPPGRPAPERVLPDGTCVARTKDRRTNKLAGAVRVPRAGILRSCAAQRSAGMIPRSASVGGLP